MKRRTAYIINLMSILILAFESIFFQDRILPIVGLTVIALIYSFVAILLAAQQEEWK